MVLQQELDTKILTTLRKTVKGMFSLLSIEFILGMTINLFGITSKDSKEYAMSLFGRVAFMLHGVVGLLLLIGAVVIVVFSMKSKTNMWIKTASFGLLSILVAFGGGVLTDSIKGDFSKVFSFIMAMGFLFAFISYGKLMSQLHK